MARKPKLDYANLSKYLNDLAAKCGSDKAIDSIQKMVLYEGAKVYADALRKAAEKHGNLADGLALTQMVYDGDWSIRLGFYGYDSDGKAYALKAAVISSGTSDDRVTGNNFINKAIRSATPEAQAEMEARLGALMEKVIGG